MNPLRVSCQIFANQREGEEKSNVKVNKHWKTRAMSNDAIPIIISSNQHFASIFSLDIFKFQRRSCKLSFSSRPAARMPRRACSQVNQPCPLDSTGALLQILSIRGKKIQNFTQIENVSKLDIYPAWPMYVLQNWTGNIIPHSLLLSVLKSVNFRNFADLYLRSLKSISFNFGTLTNFKALFSVVSTDFP